MDGWNENENTESGNKFIIHLKHASPNDSSKEESLTTEEISNRMLVDFRKTDKQQ